MQHQSFAPTINALRAASPAGALHAKLVSPAAACTQPPLVVLHGISRNADELVDLFRSEARRTGRKVVVPHFSLQDWPIFQRPCRAARPDQALLALLNQLAAEDPDFAGRVDLFGHSGGAQLAHRFAMLYPHKVGRLNLAAAGWYCLPDTGMAYPYGLGVDATPASLVWARRHRQALPAFLRLPIRVFVGTSDTDRDVSLRQSAALDRVQGTTRLARAETYVTHLRAAARAQGIVPDIALTLLPGVSHDVAEAIRLGRLDRLVMEGVGAASLPRATVS